MASEFSQLYPVAVCSPHVYLADPSVNAEEIARVAKEAVKAGARILVLPELSLTGATCADLFLQPLLISAAKKELLKLARKTKAMGATLVVGAPLEIDGSLYNVAAVLDGGTVKGIVPKVYSPSHPSVHELRWFADGSSLKTSVELGGKKVPVDPAFTLKNPFRRRRTRSSLPRDMHVVVGNMPFVQAVDEQKGTKGLFGGVSNVNGAHLKSSTIIANPTATPAIAAPLSPEERVQAFIETHDLCVARAGAGEGESTTDFVLNSICYLKQKGAAPLVFSETGWYMGAQSDADTGKGRNKTAAGTTSPKQTAANLAEPFLTADKERAAAICDKAFSIQVRGLKQRVVMTGIKKLVVGVSGGLDSTLALLVSACVLQELALPKKNLIAISMPGFGTTKKTKSNAELLANELGATYKEIPIADAVRQHFRDIGHRMDDHNSAFENAQARERTQILMDAANDAGALVVGTGDLSEAALGWATYNGDHMSMYNVNGGVPKTMVRAIVEDIAAEAAGSLAEVLLAIVDTPISPELLPPQKGQIQQKTEDLVGPYELHDFFLYHFLRDHMTPKEIFRLAKKAFPKTAPCTIVKWEKVFFTRFFSQQFKRNCSVDGPQATEISFSPRAGFEMPSDASVALWLKEVNSLR